MIKKIQLILLIGLIFASSCLVASAKKVKVYTPESDYKYQQSILRKDEKEKYERSLFPKSGYMTKEEYEELSKDIPNSEISIPEYKMPKDINAEYVPQPTYKLVRYNNPPGSPDLKLERRFKFDRQVNGKAITSPNRDIMVYPVVYYYARSQSSAGDLFVIPLDKTLPDVDRILRANVIKRYPEPILSTEKEIRDDCIFRSMTPIDFSADGMKILAKEKIGSSNDGIWKTNLWVYDFTTRRAKHLFEIREAIKFYWKNIEGLNLDEKRWDIIPLGFDASDDNRIVVSAFGYTGKTPKFLGNWSIDCQGQRTMLLSLFEAGAKVSVNGFMVVQDGMVNPAKVYNDQKKSQKIAKKKRAVDKKEVKKEKKLKKRAYKNTIKQMKNEEKKVIKDYHSKQKKSSATAVEPPEKNDAQ